MEIWSKLMCSFNWLQLSPILSRPTPKNALATITTNTSLIYFKVTRVLEQKKWKFVIFKTIFFVYFWVSPFRFQGHSVNNALPALDDDSKKEFLVCFLILLLYYVWRLVPSPKFNDDNYRRFVYRPNNENETKVLWRGERWMEEQFEFFEKFEKIEIEWNSSSLIRLALRRNYTNWLIWWSMVEQLANAVDQW